VKGIQGRQAALVALFLIGTACTGGSQPTLRPRQTLPFARGGTLRLTILGWDDHAFGLATDNGKGYYALDPQAEGGPAWELFRCCLLRTLLSYSGQPTARGGADPRPDLAAGYPTVSPDGLTWRFRLRRGIHYAPPFEHTEVVAQDFIRGIERGLSPSVSPDPNGPRGFTPINRDFDDLYWVIQGAKHYEFGKTDTITGLEAPDPFTLVIHLTEPTGDLPYRMAMPETAPIPPSPTDPTAPLGAETGHSEGDGPFLIGSGPYMIEGSPKLDFRLPPDQQHGAAGYMYGISLTLVRNPSWDPATDPLRPAYPDRIELKLENSGGSVHDGEASDLAAGRIDIAYFWEGAAPPSEEKLLPSFLADPELRPRLHIYPADFLGWMSMNMAVAPFDDLHVRKSVNLIMDKEAVHQLNGGHTEADIAGHLAFDSLEDDLLFNFDPYRTPGEHGSLDAAEAEMRLSQYDHDHDGLCDDPVCRRIGVPIGSFDTGYFDELFGIVQRSLAKIGLHLVATQIPPGDDYFSFASDPSNHVGMKIYEGRFKNFPSGSDFFVASFAPASGIDHSLIGATPHQLRAWGYKVRPVPSVTDRVHQCEATIGSSQPRCWADLDQYLMTEVVPWIPLLVHNRQRIVSSRVVSFTYDQFTTLPALDRIALRTGTEPSPTPTPTIGPVPAIPDGVYRTTITAQDFRSFHGTSDPDSLRENTGSFTISLHGGRFELMESADHKFYAPLNLGRYSGTGDTVVFTTDQPTFNQLTTPSMRWTFDGHALHFTFLGCGDLDTADPQNAHLCEDIKVLYEAHRWEKVG
jgi:peptide/nickel transport system substrate-binding protein